MEGISLFKYNTLLELYKCFSTNYPRGLEVTYGVKPDKSCKNSLDPFDILYFIHRI